MLKKILEFFKRKKRGEDYIVTLDLQYDAIINYCDDFEEAEKEADSLQRSTEMDNGDCLHEIVIAKIVSRRNVKTHI